MPGTDGRMWRRHSSTLTTRARAMRQEATPAERMVWHALRRNALGARFRRQEPKGPYILDFVCHQYRLAIEIDGNSHTDTAKDLTRDAWLRQQGYTVLRFSNQHVYASIDGVLARIEDALNEAGATTPSQPAGCPPS